LFKTFSLNNLKNKLKIKKKGPQTKHPNKLEPGHYQSPINIETKLCVFDPNLVQFPLKVNYNDKSCSQIKNTGYTFQVDGFAENSSGN
jgi:hypothetical protein